MKALQKVMTAAGAMAILASAGCGGVAFAGGPAVGLNLGGLNARSLSLVPSNCLSTYSGLGLGMNAAVLAGERMQQISQLQARHNLSSSDIRAQQALWKTVAEGGC